LSYRFSSSGLFFFFQAEDGIRDFHVTGVQTCALPIYTHDESQIRTDHPLHRAAAVVLYPREFARFAATPLFGMQFGESLAGEKRSEERRVGKECRSRGSPQHQKKYEGREGEHRGVSTG